MQDILDKTLQFPFQRALLIIQTRSIQSKLTTNNEAVSALNLFEILERTVMESGFITLWRGNILFIASAVLSRLISYITVPIFRRYIPTNKRRSLFLQNLACMVLLGSGAVALSLFFVYPLNYCQTRISVSATRFANIGDCLVSTVNGADSYYAIYSGFITQALGTIPYRLAQLLLSQYWPPSLPVRLKNVAGALFAGFVSFPFTTLMLYQQIQADIDPRAKICGNALSCALHIYNTEGFLGFYNGYLTSTVLMLFPVMFNRLLILSAPVKAAPNDKEK